METVAKLKSTVSELVEARRAGRGIGPAVRDCLKTLQNLCRRAISPSGSRLGTNHRSSGKFFRLSYLRQVIDLSPQKIRAGLRLRDEGPALDLDFCPNFFTPFHSSLGMTASASISTSISGLIKRLTSTMLVAGRISRKNAPWARPIFSQSSMFVT